LHGQLDYMFLQYYQIFPLRNPRRTCLCGSDAPRRKSPHFRGLRRSPDLFIMSALPLRVPGRCKGCFFLPISWSQRQFHVICHTLFENKAEYKSRLTLHLYSNCHASRCQSIPGALGYSIINGFISRQYQTTVDRYL